MKFITFLTIHATVQKYIFKLFYVTLFIECSIVNLN
jgi:hypothetical protein